MESILKSTLTLFALLDPIALVPLLIASVGHLPMEARLKFIRTLSLFVFGTLLGVGLFGNFILSTVGVSLGAMRVAGGIAALIAGVQLLLATPDLNRGVAPVTPGLSPLGIPMLIGPASLSFMVANSSVQSMEGILYVAAAPAIVALATYLIFKLGLRLGGWMGPDSIAITEKLSAFLLAALSVELIVSGLKELFPGIVS